MSDPQSWPVVANVKTPTEALEAIHTLLMNLQPHIPQACHPGHAVFVDNYVNPCLAICAKFLAEGPRLAEQKGTPCYT